MSMQHQVPGIGTYVSHNLVANGDHMYGNHTNHLLSDMEFDGKYMLKVKESKDKDRLILSINGNYIQVVGKHVDMFNVRCQDLDYCKDIYTLQQRGRSDTSHMETIIDKLIQVSEMDSKCEKCLDVKAVYDGRHSIVCG